MKEHKAVAHAGASGDGAGAKDCILRRTFRIGGCIDEYRSHTPVKDESSRVEHDQGAMALLMGEGIDLLADVVELYHDDAVRFEEPYNVGDRSSGYAKLLSGVLCESGDVF